MVEAMAIAAIPLLTPASKRDFAFLFRSRPGIQPFRFFCVRVRRFLRLPSEYELPLTLVKPPMKPAFGKP